MKVGLLAFALVCAAAGVPSVEASERADVEKARAHFQSAQRLYQVSRYRDALELFKEAYLTHPDPAFLYNIGQCHRLLGDRADAITFYKRFLKAVPDTRLRPEVERRIAELESPQAEKAAPPESAPAVLPAPPPRAPGTEAAATPAALEARALPAAGSPAAGPPAGTIASAPPPASSPASPVPAGKAPLYRRWWVWTGATALAAGIVTAVIIGAGGGGSSASCGPGVDYCSSLPR